MIKDEHSGTFDHNLRYLREKIYQETEAAFAERLGVSAEQLIPGKQQANHEELCKKLADKCRVDLHHFLTDRMNEENKDRFFFPEKGASPSKSDYSEIYELLDRVTKEEDAGKRAEQVEKLRESITRRLDERDKLKEELIYIYEKFSTFASQYSSITSHYENTKLSLKWWGKKKNENKKKWWGTKKNKVSEEKKSDDQEV